METASMAVMVKPPRAGLTDECPQTLNVHVSVVPRTLCVHRSVKVDLEQALLPCGFASISILYIKMIFTLLFAKSC